MVGGKHVCIGVVKPVIDRPGPLDDVRAVAARLRGGRTDACSLARVLTDTLAEALPSDMVEVRYRRGVADRLTGGRGRAVGVLVHGGDHDLGLRQRHGGVDTEVCRVAGGVVVDRGPVDLDTWLWILAETVLDTAIRSPDAERAITRFLCAGPS